MFLVHLSFDPDGDSEYYMVVASKGEAQRAIVAELNTSEVLTEDQPFTSYEEALERAHEVVTWSITPLTPGQFTPEEPTTR